LFRVASFTRYRERREGDLGGSNTKVGKGEEGRGERDGMGGTRDRGMESREDSTTSKMRRKRNYLAPTKQVVLCSKAYSVPSLLTNKQRMAFELK
jgi:hypothetical protein